MHSTGKIAFIFLLLANVCFAQTGIELSDKITDNDSVPMTTVRLITDSDTLVPSYIQLDETVIRARSKVMVRNAELGVINFNSQKLSSIPSIMGAPDINRVLQLMPGVQHSGEANGHLYVRGAEPGHNLILYNNVPIYGASHLLGIFPFYNADHIDRFHFDKSGSEVQFGNRLGATVQCLPPDALPDSFAIKGNIGLMVSQMTVSSPLGKKAGVIFSGRQTYMDRIITPLITNKSNDNNIDQFGYSFTDANFTLMIRPGEKHNIDVNVFATGDRFSIEDEKMLLDGKMKWGNQLAAIKWDYRLKKDVKLSNEVYFSRYANLLWVGQADLDLQLESEVFDWGFNTGVDFKLFSIPCMAGVQYSNYRVRPQDLSSETLPVPLELKNTTTAQLVSSYLHLKPSMGEYLSLDAGLRMDIYAGNDNNRKVDFRLEPRINLHLTDGDKWSGYLSYARKSQRLHLITTSSVGFPTDFWIAASGEIPVEVADNFSTGANYKALANLELTVGLFYSRMDNLIHYPLNVLQFSEMTSFSNDLYVGKGKARGVEWMIKKSGRLSGWASYTWSKSDRQFDEIDKGQTFPSKFDRRHNLSAAVIYEINQRWSAGLTQVFTSGSRFTTPTSWYFINNNPVKEYGKYNNAKMPNYKRTDISVDYYIKKTSRRESVLNFSVYNLFAINNPIYVVLDVRSSETSSMIEVVTRYKSMYTILPSISWRFKF